MFEVTMPLTGPPVPPDLIGQSFLKRAYEKLKEYGKSVFLIDTSNKHYTFENVLQRSTSIAVKLQKLGIKKDCVVASLVDNSVESVSFQLGIWFSGGISNPVNHFLKPGEIRTCIITSHPVIIFCEIQYLKLVEDSIKNIGWDIIIITKQKVSQYLSYDDLLNEDVSKFDVVIDDPVKHVLLALFTSGTTGFPKAVKLSDEAMLISSSMKHWQPHSNILLSSPMFWISNTFIITKAVVNNTTVLFSAESNAEGLLDCITKLKPECLFVTSSILVEMSILPNIHKYDTSSLKAVIFGGSIVYPEQKKRTRKIVFNDLNVLIVGYGSTETGLISCQNETPVDSPEYDSVGQLVSGITLKVVDLESGKELGPGQDGEICVKSESFMSGYMNKNLQNDDLDSEGWWHMGDIGHYDGKGYIYITSRLKEIMKYRGVQISPAELEAVLYRHPDVIEACVVAKPHDIDGDWPAAFVIKQTNSSLTEDELCTLIEENVADSKKLRGGVHFVSSFPRNAVGKMLKSELVNLLHK